MLSKNDKICKPVILRDPNPYANNYDGVKIENVEIIQIELWKIGFMA